VGKNVSGIEFVKFFRHILGHLDPNKHENSSYKTKTSHKVKLVFYIPY